MWGEAWRAQCPQSYSRAILLKTGMAFGVSIRSNFTSMKVRAVGSVAASLTVILLGGVICIGSHQLDPRAPIPGKSDPLHVDVVALDWKWLFIYPDQGVAMLNQLVIPAETPVEFRLTSATVMNSFFVPQLGSQIYAMSGMATHLNLLAGCPPRSPDSVALPWHRCVQSGGSVPSH